jgi:transcriptional regulator with XRE-family HTH domain
MLSIAQVERANNAMTTRAGWSRPQRVPTLDIVGPDASELEYRRRLGKTIVQLRALLGEGVSQAWLAEQIGRSEAAVSRWETGKATPSAYDLRRLMQILAAPADLLLEPLDGPISPVAQLLEERAAAGVRKGRAPVGASGGGG